MKVVIPQSVRTCLWSYDIDKIDLTLQDHKIRVILNVLNRGTYDAVLWLRATFSNAEISDVISKSSSSEWSKRSIALWSLVFGSKPKENSEFV